MDGKDEQQKPNDRLRARKRMMDLMAVRDHSELEIRAKLKDKFEPADIDAAVDYGRENGWLPDNETSQRALANKMAEFLHKKLKGIHYINHALEEKGLPPLDPDPERELEKARSLLETKFSDQDLRDRQAQAKAGRFLASRGFSMDVVRSVIFKR